VASDAHFGGRPNGAFTYHFLQSLEGGAGSRAAILAQVKAALEDGNFAQVPQLEAAAKAKKVPFGSRW
jgi:hypothetical protein